MRLNGTFSVQHRRLVLFLGIDFIVININDEFMRFVLLKCVQYCTLFVDVCRSICKNTILGV